MVLLMASASTTALDTPMPMPDGMRVEDGALSETDAASACAVLDAAASMLDHMVAQSVACVTKGARCMQFEKKGRQYASLLE